jgi:hypothetical protein
MCWLRMLCQHLLEVSHAKYQENKPAEAAHVNVHKYCAHFYIYKKP